MNTFKNIKYFWRKLSILLILLFSLNPAFGMDKIEDRFDRLIITRNDSEVGSNSDSDSDSDSDYDYEPEGDSDSEDEENLQYIPFKSFKMPTDLGKEYYVFYRGIHFFPSKFDKERRSYFRRLDLSEKPIDSSAVVCRDSGLSRDKSIFNTKKDVSRLVDKYPIDSRKYYYVVYKNRYKEFLDKFKLLPVISTTEFIDKAFNYACVINDYKASSTDIELNPEYNDFGRPRHPYLGFIYVILIPEDRINKIDSFFYVNEYITNSSLKVDSHKYQDHEVLFVASIQGEFVVCNFPVRVPNFEKKYNQNYHESKYGLSREKFNSFKNQILDDKDYDLTPLFKHIFKYKKKEIEKFMKDRGLSFGYKYPDGSFKTEPLKVGNRNIKKIRKEYSRN